MTWEVECAGVAVEKMIVEEAPRPEDAGIIMSAAFSPDGLLFAGVIQLSLSRFAPTRNVP